MRIWAAPTADSEISTVLEGIRGGDEVNGDSQREKGLWQQWPKKNIYYSYVLTCSVDSFGFFFLSFFLSATSVVVDDFIGTMKSN